MNVDWQTVLSLVIVAVAAAALSWHVVRFIVRPQSRGCRTCPANDRANRVKNLPLVQLSGPQTARRKATKMN